MCYRVEKTSVELSLAGTLQSTSNTVLRLKTFVGWGSGGSGRGASLCSSNETNKDCEFWGTSESRSFILRDPKMAKITLSFKTMHVQEAGSGVKSFKRLKTLGGHHYVLQIKRTKRECGTCAIWGTSESRSFISRDLKMEKLLCPSEHFTCK